MASCFFLIRNSVDMYKITKTVIFSRARDFGFSLSPRDMYYQFYKNAPAEGSFQNHPKVELLKVINPVSGVVADNILTVILK